MVIKTDMLYPAAQENRPLHIYLPKGYETGEKRYPVMYFFDGHNLFFDEDATFGKSWGLREFLDQQGTELIVVGAECAKSGPGEFDQRSYEYMPLPSDAGAINPFLGIGGDNEPLGESIVGIGEETMRWLVEDVKPYIDRTYRTLKDRDHTGLGGSSMGGLMSAFSIFRHNAVYSRALCVSPAVPFCMGAMRKLMETAAFDEKTRVFLSWGTLEAAGCQDPEKEDTTSLLYRACSEIAGVISANGGTARLYSQVGGRHSEAYWEKQLPLALPFLWPELF